MLWLNFKTYPLGIGDRGLEIAKFCEEVSTETGVDIAICPTAPDIYRISQLINLEVWAQHVDPVETGKFTGYLVPESISVAGGSGAIINHAEHRVPINVIEKAVERCREVGLKIMVCSSSVEEAIKIDTFEPDFIAFEDPELIGGDVSIVESESLKIKQVIEEVNNALVVVGAGVNSAMDIAESRHLGAYGVLISSAVMKKSQDPLQTLHELVEGFQIKL